MVAFATATSAHRLHRATYEPDFSRARRGVSDLEVERAPHRRVGHSADCSARPPDTTSRPPVVMDRRRNAGPNPRSPLRGEVEELPMVVQRTGIGQKSRPEDHRDVCCWTWQSQRSGPLPCLAAYRFAMRCPRTRARRWWLPWSRRPRDADLSRQANGARPRMAASSSPSCSRRARARETQGLAHASRPSAARSLSR